MVWRRIAALVVLALASGSILALLFNLKSEPVAADSEFVSAPPVEGPHGQGISQLQLDVTPVGNGEATPEGSVKALDEPHPINQSRSDAFKEMVHTAEDPKLLPAGFSAERIAWIRQRSVELKLERDLSERERRERGEPPPPLNIAMAYLYDRDRDLREEIGDEEYIRYRQALGRPVDVEVLEFRPGSNAARAGILIGDGILSYGGRRVFNPPELDDLAERNSSESVTVDVLRNGQLMQITLPKGAVGIKGPSVSQSEPMPFTFPLK